MWLFLSLITAFFWGVAQLLVKKGLTKITPLVNNIIYDIIFFIIIGCLTFSNGINFKLLFLVIPFTVIIAFCYLSYYYILKKGQLSLTGTVMAGYPIFTIVLAHLLLAERVSEFQFLAIMIVIFGMIMISLPSERISIKSLKKQSWFYWGVVYAILAGLGDFISKVAINKSDLYTFLFALSLSFLFTSLIYFVVDKKSRMPLSFSFEQYKYAVSGNLMMVFGMLTFYTAISSGLVSLVTPISSTYAAITVVLSIKFLHEKITKIQSFAILLLILGIILIGL
ncbi:hypothetical protein A3C23_00350 [Candidatus Roizmanbacteria bacterium RIFCSPHIGHO2_02_FULL_37_13b]|uniref:EamA domain-containing protein n=1 Tax=Candidatus Roizmanbacteria bacterium RIFCSPLOWO2_02_FULL_36_11 TaxID=1802071 RepID=A0A1F7JBH0_9BACT|nr:MAG: hypothetical protein A3C23_00350 [Candidatus Roizmanbacteria bacterium RIFCSPHIGHO2_02_FULL_37_13b]OGK52953.1 MAG: hypothetical protein A3H78_02460 [Candidatus Roizmanbacteria bacterium RIFCSPLOWO2_02_FULL_36_11]